MILVFINSGLTQPTKSKQLITRKTASEKLNKTYKKGIKYSLAG